jgi:6-phosphogluconolactonase (cycloisomerase 2 family)
MKLLALALSVLGTGLMTNSYAASTLAFAPIYTEDTIAGFNFDEEAAKLLKWPESIPTKYRAMDLAIHPSNKFAYVISNDSTSPQNTSTTSLQLHKIIDDKIMYPAKDYKLVNRACNPIPNPDRCVGTGASNVIIDNTGRFVYVVSAMNGSNIPYVFGYAIDQGTGMLEELPGSPYAPNATYAENYGYYAGLTKVSKSPDGNYLYLPHYSNMTVSIYKINANTGILEKVTGNAVTLNDLASPHFFNIGSTGLFAHTQAAPSNEILTYSRDPQTGNLNPNPVSTLQGDGQLDQIVETPDGRFAYGVDKTNQAVQTFTVDSDTGALSKLDSQHIEGARFLTVAPSGKYLSVSTNTHIIGCDVEGSTGQLTCDNHNPIHVGEGVRQLRFTTHPETE